MWVLAPVLGVIAFIILLLLIPVNVDFNVEKHSAFHTRVRIRWMFNAIGKTIESGEKPKKGKPEAKKKSRIKPVTAALGARGFPGRLLRLVRDIFRISHARDVALHLLIGMNDPADTGMVFAFVAPAVVQLRAITPYDIRIQPDFEEAELQGYLKGRVRVFPIQLIYVGTLFALSPATIRAIRALVAAWRK